MTKNIFTLAEGTLLGVLLTSFTLISCQHMGNHAATTQQSLQASSQPAGATSNNGPSGQASALSADELRKVLSDFANAHNDKIKLSWWVSTPLRPVDDAFHPFFSNMGKQNKALLAELQGWAKQHNVDLTYHPNGGFAGTAEKIMDDRQEQLVRHDDKTTFQHDILVQMYNDYENNLSECQALLPTLTDPALKSYVEKASKMYSDGSAEILALLHRYKFQ